MRDIEVKISPEVKAMFIRLTDRRPVETIEFIHSALLVDVDEDDVLIGIEVLMPGVLGQVKALLEEEGVDVPSNFHTLDFQEIEQRYQREIALCKR